METVYKLDFLLDGGAVTKGYFSSDAKAREYMQKLVSAWRDRQGEFDMRRDPVRAYLESEGFKDYGVFVVPVDNEPEEEPEAKKPKTHLARRLKQLREQDGRTVEELGEIPGIISYDLSRVEEDEQYPEFYDICALAEALNVPIIELLSSADDSRPGVPSAPETTAEAVGEGSTTNELTHVCLLVGIRSDNTDAVLGVYENYNAANAGLYKKAADRANLLVGDIVTKEAVQAYLTRFDLKATKILTFLVER
jgi:transcriptional regulator with XRE-family HTH domain